MRCNQWCGVVLVAVLALAAPSHGVVLTDPTLVFGANAIDPDGAQSVNANATSTNLATQATLEAIESFGAVQSFTGWTALSTGASNYIDFTNDPLRADLRFTATANSNGSQNGRDVTDNDNQVTSAGSGVRLWYLSQPASGSVGTMAVTLTFGTYDEGSFTAYDKTTWAAGFTLSGLTTNHSVTVEFLDVDGAVLSMQTAAGNATDTGEATGLDYYFGYMGDKDDLDSYIGSIVITREWISDGSTFWPLGLDDVGWTTIIPEPSATMLLGVSLMGLVGRRRRH